MNEFHIGKGAIPVIGNGGANGAPEVLKNVSPELLEGYIFIVANWGLKGQEQIIDAFKKRTGEPWMTQDASMPTATSGSLRRRWRKSAAPTKSRWPRQIH